MIYFLSYQLHFVLFGEYGSLYTPIERRIIVNDEIALKAEIERFTDDMAHQSDASKNWLQTHSPSEYWLSPWVQPSLLRGRDSFLNFMFERV